MKFLFNYSTIFLIIAGLTAQVGINHNARTISGSVTSQEDGSPLEGVVVTVKGGGTPSGTQADGMYYLPVGDKDSVLVFSLDGFQTQELRLSAAKEYNVALHRDQGRPDKNALSAR